MRALELKLKKYWWVWIPAQIKVSILQCVYQVFAQLEPAALYSPAQFYGIPVNIDGHGSNAGPVPSRVYIPPPFQPQEKSLLQIHTKSSLYDACSYMHSCCRHNSSDNYKAGGFREFKDVPPMAFHTPGRHRTPVFTFVCLTVMPTPYLHHVKELCMHDMIEPYVQVQSTKQELIRWVQLLSSSVGC